MPLRDTLYTLTKYTASALGITVISAGALLYAFQTRLIYPSNIPSGSRTIVATPDEFDMPHYENVELTTPDGVRIRAFLILQRETDPASVKASDRPTVLLLHANAGNVGHRLPIAKVFHKNMRCNVLALSYRGYGLSEGTPDEQGIMLDAQTALDYILSHPVLEKTKIFLYGQSIGGAVAIFLAARNANRVHGLVVENTFLSLPQLVPHIMPYLAPFIPYLLHQIWPSEQRVAQLPPDFPVLFLAGERDEMVEPGQMRRLFQLCSSERKEWTSFEFGTHNDTCIQPHYFEHVASFIAKVAGLKLASSSSSSSSSASSSGDKVKSPASQSSLSSSAVGSEDGGETETETETESFELVDRDEGGDAVRSGESAEEAHMNTNAKEKEKEREDIRDEGGALSVDPLAAVKEKL